MRAGSCCAAAVMAAMFAGCGGDGGGIAVAEDPPKPECIRPTPPRTYSIYFVIDVSGSMGPFLKDLSNQLFTFADAFPEFDDEGRRVTVDYYVVAFVNDVKSFGGRMTAVYAIQDSIEKAIAAGATDYNLNARTFNAETEENMLDALASVVAAKPATEATLIMLATDAGFVEAPAMLNQGIAVRATYSSVLEGLRGIDARVHAFTSTLIDGLTQGYEGQPALTSLPGSSTYSLSGLTGASDRMRETLGLIARNAACQ